MDLESFLHSAHNSLTRENILRHRFLYDVKLAAAKRGYSLITYQSEVDNEGYDIILDDGDYRKPIQLKSIIKGARTQGWHIQKKMLRPTLEMAKAMNYDWGHQSTGDGGGIVLQEFVVHNKGLEVNYYYTDLFILLLFSECIIERLDRRTRNILLGIVLHYSDGRGNEKIRVTKSMFVKAKSPEALLGLCGLHNTICGDWINYLIRILNKNIKAPKKIRIQEIPERILKQEIGKEIKKLCFDRVLS